MKCLGCGAMSGPVDVVVRGAAAQQRCVPDGTVVMSVPACSACLAKSHAELERLRVEFRRLKKRLRTRATASAIMCRRVERYFRNGTFRPLVER